MIQNLLLKFLKMALMTLAGSLIAFLSMIAAYHPAASDQPTLWLFGAISAGATALIALIKRWIQYDSTKVGT